MALLTKIRNRAGILVVVIGLSLAAFLLMDALNSNSSLLRGGADNNVGIINGQEIPIQAFEAKLAEAVETYKMNAQKQEVDQEVMQYLREQTWNQYIKDVILSKEYEKLGLNISGDELFDLVQGVNPHQAIVNAFTNPETGVFDRARVLVFLKNMDNDQTGDSRKKWLGMEKYIKEDQLTQKYIGLVKNGLYVPTWLAENAYKESNQTVNLDYVLVPYSFIADSQISFMDSDLEDYLESHSKEYKQQPSAKIEYYTFDIIPSFEDTLNTKKYIEEEIPNFTKVENDSIYINLYSDERFNPKYYKLEELEETTTIADSLFKVDTNTIIGPFFEEGAFKAVKLLDRKLIPDSVHARHILLKVAEGQNPQEIVAQIDSFKKMVEEGADFAQLAAQNSQDPGSASKGGDLGWVKPDEMVPNFNNAIFYAGKKGDLLKVPTQFGLHLIQIVESTPSKMAVKIAPLVKIIYPSSETESIIYNKAYELAGKSRTAEDFENAAENFDLFKRTAENIGINDYTVTGLGPARELVKWAYKNDVGTISDVISTEDKFIIARLVSKSMDETPSLEELRAEIETKVIQKKKFDFLKNEIDKKGIAKKMEDLAGQYNTEIKSANNISFSNIFIPGQGREPRVIGTAFGMKEQAVSAPISGEKGLYVIKVTGLSEPEPIADVSNYKTRLSESYIRNVDFVKLFESLKEQADITDNRYKFY